jgi:hypothetical protein
MSKAKQSPALIVPSVRSLTALEITGTADGAPDKAVGAKLTELYHEAQSAELSILRFGAAFWAVEQAVLATRGQNSPERGPGAYGFSSWLRDNAPEIALATARRYRDVAEATAQRFKITDPVRVFSLAPEKLDDAERAKRDKVVDFVADKSMRGLQLELGLVTTRGGDNTPRDAEGKRLPAAPKDLVCPAWATEGEKALWDRLPSERAKLAFIDWRPRIGQMAKQASDIKAGFLPDMDDQTKADLVATLCEVLAFVAPHTLKHAPKA